MKTGEGKSLVICVIAIFEGLKNKKVNILTSKSLLAERDS